MEKFFAAIKENDITTLQALVLVDKDLNINQSDEEGRNAFLLAAQYADCATLKWLVQQGADFKESDYLRRTALYYLIFESLNSHQVKSEKLAYLLSLGLSFEPPSLAFACSDKWQALQTDYPNHKALLDLQDESDFTLLHYAAAWGNAALVKWLLQEIKSDMASKSIFQETALHCAVTCNQVLIVKQLLETGANPNEQDDEGRTPLFLALQKEHWDIVDLLWQQPTIQLDLVSEDGRTLLHVAARQGYLAMVEQLLTRQVDINVTDAKGVTPLNYAARHGHLIIVKQLLACKADVNLADINEVTPLYSAAQNGHLAVVEVLLQNPTLNVDAVCEEDMTALHVAAMQGHQVILEKLLSHQAKIHAVSDIGATPLHYAALEGHIAVVEVLLQQPAININAMSYEGITPLHVAAINGHHAIVSMMLAHQACVLAVDNKGQSALHFAAAAGHQVCVDLLLAAKAQIDLTDDKLRTPLAVAVSQGHVAVVQVLLNAQLVQHPQVQFDAHLLLLALKKGFSDASLLLLPHVFNIPLGDKGEQRTLALAAKLGNLELVKQLLNRNQASYAFTNDKSLALKEAAHAGHLDIVILLTESGVDINEPQAPPEDSPLYHACCYGHVDVVEYLLSQQVDPALSFCETTFLHTAVHSGVLALVEIALQYQGKVNAVDKIGATALHIAVRKGYIEITTYLISQGADVNLLTNSCQESAFLFAAEKGHIELAKVLIDKVTNINYKGGNGEETALYIACKNGHEAFAIWLLEMGADPLIEFEEDTLLQVAVKNGLRKVVEVLLKYNLNINQQNSYLESLLYLAIKKKHDAIAELLLEAGADVNLVSNSSENDSPLLLAIEQGSFELIKRLVQKGADLNYIGGYEGKTAFELACDKGFGRKVEYLMQFMPEVAMDDFAKKNISLHMAVKSGVNTLVEALLQRGVNVNQLDNRQESPLHIAARDGDEELVNLLLQSGAQIDIRNVTDKSPLLIASEYNHLSVVKMLVEKGADINQQGAYEQKTALYIACECGYEKLSHWLLAHEADVLKMAEGDKTALHVAAKGGHKSIVKLLLKYTVNVNQKNASLETPLHLAINNNYDAIARLLLASGADIHVLNADGQSPLALAVEEGQIALVKELLDAKADTTVINETGQTLLHIATEKDQPVIAKLLLELVSVEKKDSEGFTPLHLASREGYTALVQLFIKAKANINASTNENETPLSLAIKHGHPAVLKILLAAMLKETQSQMTEADSRYLLQALEDKNYKLTKLLLPFMRDLELKNAEGKTALCLAAEVGYVDIVKQLLEKYKLAGKLFSENEDFPLHEAAAQGHFSVVKLLLDKGFPKDQIDSYHKRTALYLACEKGHQDVVKYLIYHQADTLMPFDDRKTLWHAVASQNDSYMVELLLPFNIPLEQADIHGYTSLHIAIENSHLKIVEKLLEAKVQVNQVNYQNETPLLLATRRRDLESVALLLSAGADCELADQEGQTPLFIAAQHDQIAIIKLLFEANANIHQARKDGETPLTIAIKQNFMQRAANLLLELGAGIYAYIPPLIGRTKTKNCVVIGATQTGLPINRAMSGWQKAITCFEELTEALHQQPVAINRKALIKTCTQLIRNTHPQAPKIEALRSHLYYTNSLFERCLLELHLPYNTIMEKTYRELRRKFYQKEIFFSPILIEKLAEQEEDAELKNYSHNFKC